MTTRRLVLVAVPELERQRELASALDGYDVVAIGSVDELSSLEDRVVDVALVAETLGRSSGLELLARIKGRSPAVRTAIFATYQALPGLVRERARRRLDRALQVHTRPEHVRRVVDELLGVATVLSSPDESAASRILDDKEVNDLLLSTARILAQVAGVVIRQPPKGAFVKQLQFVVPVVATETLREDLGVLWRLPLKLRNAKLGRDVEEHVAVQALGRMEIDQELFACSAGTSRTSLYLAILPWRREARATVAIGVAGECTDEWSVRLLATHGAAVAEVSEFPLPSDKTNVTRSVVAALEYDWVITDGYVGPDRRERPTSLLNRYFLLGRRRRIASRMTTLIDPFVDGLRPSVVGLGMLYLALSTVDTVLTYVYVRQGVVREVNPLLRYLLQYPWAFVSAKYALSVGAFLLVARFQLFRAGPYLLLLTVLVYLVLDIYWLILLR